ncbi:uncharacterized protein LOC111089070 [Limulus polyphemus]|uniref:Uncharacterized protein LOC111089070 n=1 Tax=Limulus polyphemus TaxID=6850 RepID=A0ABM1TKX2_LIMPO|nr:uncharacterized protein LOC111089070 [Limulus polyphemus]
MFQVDLNKLLVCLLLIPCGFGSPINHNSGRPVSWKQKYAREWAWDPFEVGKHVKFPLRIAHSTECCPSVSEIVQPMGGVSRSGRILELYHDRNSTQKFYQTSCLEEVRGRPCRFLSPPLIHHSHCIQKYSFTYALVREYGTNVTWRLDYIRIRSGCTCEINNIAMIV